MGEFAVHGLAKRYDSGGGLRGVDLSFPTGRITAVLGPSGCGKTTLLRLLAGLATPDAGEVVLDGETVNDPAIRVPPERRGVGMVFQDSLLWPHMDVRGNIAFPLGPGTRHDARVASAARAAEVERFLDRRPFALSGGEQRRVAIARAVVAAPRLLLLDEPLAALDAHLRVRLLAAVRDLQRRLGVTTVYVTHDQQEALGIADVIVVMHDGRILQSGSPEEVYSRPRTAFVASFVGISSLVPGEVRGGVAETALGRFAAPGRADGPALFAVRPETVREAGGGVAARCLGSLFAGGRWLTRYDVSAREVLGYSERPADPGREVTLAFEPPPPAVDADATES